MRTLKSILTLLIITVLLYSCKQESATVSKNHNYNDYYTGASLNRIAFPIGGIGSGMFCLEGTGAISHMSVRNHPEVDNEPCMFAAVSLKGVEHGAKVLEGQAPAWKKFGDPNSGNGSNGASWGLPRFENAKFLTRFPFALIDLDDKDMPLKVQIKGWSPFIPNDADNSSLPAGAIEYTFENTSSKELEAVFSYNSKNFMRMGAVRPVPGERPKPSVATVKPIENGFILSQSPTEEAPNLQGDFAIFTDQPNTIVDHCWFRGGWFDGLTMVWKAVANGETKANAPVENGAPGASLYVPFTLKAGEKKTIRLMMAWYVPVTTVRSGRDPEGTKEAPESERTYKPFYTSLFKDIQGVANFWKTSYTDLQTKSQQFTDAFYSTTLPAEVVEAVAANLTIIKSTTVLRQADGRLWSWEGCSDNNGCCAGSCTHVWNYAQAIPNLFPQLERTLRETEFLVSQSPEGHQVFRAALPIRPLEHGSSIAASDGQLGGIIKMYRDWRISGNTEWMKNMFPAVKQSMDFCIAAWDPRGTGTLEEPHHNTYDIEFWGPDPMCTSFYLGALEAIQEMGKATGQDVSNYAALYNKGKAAMESALWDGEYFIQKIQWEGLSAPNPIDAAANPAASLRTDYSPEATELLKKEGPKYQYGTGCLSDGVLGSWLAEISGLSPVVDAEKLKSHLNSIHKYNFYKDLTDHSNPQRPTYAWGNDGGLLLCSWPKGGALSLPFVYSNEVWTGIEYSAASHMMLEGQVENGLDIVRACRDRYDGTQRNPFNEYECGHWYARAMSSYAMLQALTGARYDAVDQIMYIDSKVGDFSSFFSTESGFGNVGLKGGKPFYNGVSGDLKIKNFVVSGKEVTL